MVSSAPVRSPESESSASSLHAIFEKALNDDYPPPLAAILSLTETLSSHPTSTTSHLLLSLHHNSALLLSSPLATYGAQAGTRLFERWVRDAVGGAGRAVKIDDVKANIVEEGRRFAKHGASECREKISHEVQGFLKDNVTILTHSFSRVVLLALKKAHEQNKRIKVYVTEGRPGCGGLKTHAALTALGIPCTLVLDAAVGYVMDRVDVVLVGSEVVVESGGLIAGVGTYQMALLAKALNKPFYALAESYKFLRLFPLSQSDLPLLPSTNPTALSSPSSSSRPTTRSKPLSFSPTLPSPLPSPAGLSSFAAQQASSSPSSTSPSSSPKPEGSGEEKTERAEETMMKMTPEMLANNPLYDYTPRDLISLILADVGVLTPAVLWFGMEMDA